MFTKKWLLDAAERTVMTFIQTFIATLALASTLDVSTLKSAAIAGIAAALSFVKALFAAGIGQKGTASTAPGV